MPIDVVMIKVGPDRIEPAANVDREALQGWRIGEAKRFVSTDVSQRNLTRHKKYWGVLVNLVLDYWDADDLYTSSAERRVMAAIIEWYAAKGFEVAPLQEVFMAYAEHVTNERRSRVDAPKASPKRLHRWIKEKVGLYDIERTPDGLDRVEKSISFSKMGNEEFEQFYSDAFRVCWTYVLSKPFGSEEDAHQMVDRLLAAT